LAIERYAVGGDIAAGEPGFPRIGLTGATRVGLGLAVFAAGHPADQPRAAAELVMQTLEQPRHAVLGGPPPAAENAAVDARVHMRDHIGLHFRTSQLRTEFGPCTLLTLFELAFAVRAAVSAADHTHHGLLGLLVATIDRRIAHVGPQGRARAYGRREWVDR